MKKTLLLTLLLAASLAGDATNKTSCQRIDLTGTWSLELEGGFPPTTVTLPGTTDTNQKGYPLARKDETTHLSRLYSYVGKARYTKEVNIPKSWKKKGITLFLERTKPTHLFIDHQLIDSCNDISTPQVYRLTNHLKPGKHLLTIVVDNGSGVPGQLYANSHAYTEDTQTNWNGIIGRIELTVDNGQATPPSPQRHKDFHIEGHHFYAHGRKVFLRGKHDACVFPLTGHTPMDTASWRRYMTICQDYGINHIRFHSWCPPEAAFAVADELGIYLQPELPFWGDFNAQDSTLMAFLHKEGENILRTYGHHPSFVMFALGNELWGSIEKMAEFIEDFRRIAPDILYTFGSNYYLGYQGVKPGMDYFTTCRIGGEGWGNYNTHTRGSFSYADAFEGGVINHFHPNSSRNFDEACSQCTVPVISHETGQFQIYPDYGEIKKYTGVLYPCNMEVFRQRLQQAGMGDQAEAFHRASGQWSLRLYKADIEMDLRTKDMAGFQLLDLQDYPGQGSAYVGILDAFMDSKGITTPDEWRQWCNDVVPLFVTDKFCYTNAEHLTGRIEIVGEVDKSTALSWSLDGIATGIGNEVDIDLSAVDAPRQLTFRVAISGTDYHNTYPIWVYPSEDDLAMLKKGSVVTKVMTDETVKKLEEGATVLWMPDSATFADNTVGPLFQTDYWNYRMFKTICENNHKEVSPGTLGILCDPRHPLFHAFPTEEHTNWQWFPVIRHSRPLVLDNLPTGYRPVVQVIDNIERNHKLGLIMEFAIGKGRLLMCMSDLEKAAEYPEGKQFYRSVLQYMRSTDFLPANRYTFSELFSLLRQRAAEAQLEELNNISPY